MTIGQRRQNEAAVRTVLFDPRSLNGSSDFFMVCDNSQLF